MKKLLSIVTMLAVVLGLGVSAHAGNAINASHIRVFQAPEADKVVIGAKQLGPFTFYNSESLVVHVLNRAYQYEVMKKESLSIMPKFHSAFVRIYREDANGNLKLLKGFSTQGPFLIYAGTKAQYELWNSEDHVSGLTGEASLHTEGETLEITFEHSGKQTLGAPVPDAQGEPGNCFSFGDNWADFGRCADMKTPGE